MGQPLYCSAANAGVWGNGSTPYTWLSSITLLPWLPSFPPQAFPTTISFLMSPQSISPESTSALTLELLHNPYAPAPSCCAFWGTSIPVQGTQGCGKNCLILIPFRLPQISCFTLTLKCFSSYPYNCPDVGIGTLLQFSNTLRADPVLLKLVFSPSSFILLSFVWFYISFSDGQVLLSASVSESVFLMFPWREMYTVSTYSFTILYSKQVCFVLFCFFNFMAAVIFHRNFEAQKRKICHCFHISLFYLPWSGGTRGHDLCIFNDES